MSNRPTVRVQQSLELGLLIGVVVGQPQKGHGSRVSFIVIHVVAVEWHGAEETILNCPICYVNDIAEPFLQSYMS